MSHDSGARPASRRLRERPSGKSSNRCTRSSLPVDEAQDISIPQLRFLAALGASTPNTLFFAGDLGQRIFQQPFSWKALGVDVRGRSRTLRVNYRTSHQIRSQADRLLEPQVMDADGNVEERSDTVSVLNGPAPLVQVFDSQLDEQDAVAQWLQERITEGVALHEIGIFVRSTSELDRARAAAEQAGIEYRVLDERSGRGIQYRAPPARTAQG